MPAKEVYVQDDEQGAMQVSDISEASCMKLRLLHYKMHLERILWFLLLHASSALPRPCIRVYHPKNKGK